MKQNYENRNQKKYFEGWYLKHQTNDDRKNQETIAFIVGIERDKKGYMKAFIQVITNGHSYHVDFSGDEFSACENDFHIKVGNNVFSGGGINLNIVRKGISIKGSLCYTEPVDLKYDIMGPLLYLPKLECSHKIISMNHRVNGIIEMNGHVYIFKEGRGYIEKDFGASFPKNYLWTQCNHFSNDECYIVAACATIPYLKINFLGFFCAVIYKNNEYRLATYLGGRVLEFTKTKLVIKQRKYKFIAEVLKENKHPLMAPNQGEMTRIIYESAACTVRYQLYCHKKLLFDYISDYASFEFA